MKSVRLTIAFAGALAWAPPSTAVAQAQARSVKVEGAQFRLVGANGAPVAQEALPGTILTLGDGSGRQRRLRIDAVERDTRDPAGEVMLYALSEQDSASGEWRNICQPDPEGRRLGFPLAGSFTSDERYEPAPGKLLITCTGGAEGKCVRFGYKPWGKAPDGTPLEAAYNACVRHVRADYAGDGRGTTRNGQRIDIYDTLGVEVPGADPSYEFEAGFDEKGAVCVRHVRVKENATLAGVEASNSRLKGKVGETCDEAFARAEGAILFVRSPP